MDDVRISSRRQCKWLFQCSQDGGKLNCLLEDPAVGVAELECPQAKCLVRHHLLLVQGTGDVVLSTEGVDDSHVLLGELEVEGLEVGLDAVGSQRFGEDNVAAGSVPVEEDLSWALAVLLSDLANGRVLELVAAGEGRVGLNGDAVLAAGVDEVLALAEGVYLDLVDGGDNGGLLEKLLNVVGAEVGDTDGADLAEALGSLKSSPRSKALLLVV